MIADDPASPAPAAQGLTEAEARRRRSEGLANSVADRGSVPLRRILRRNVFTILNGALFSVSLVLLALGLYGDALVTAGPVALNVLVAVVQEIDAKRKLDRLTLITRPKVTLLRDQRERSAEPGEIVVGDTIVLARGDQAVVDGRIAGGSIEADEAVLTGESEPVVKGVGDDVLSGTICVGGRALVEATVVGDGTFANRLAAEARRGGDERTPLRRDLDRLILAVGAVTVAAAIPVAIALRAAGEGLFSAATVQAAAVLVALVPQGLAVMATVTYALAAVRISRAGAIVQRIDAVESMSRVDTLCLDKTGTLTTQNLVMDDLVPFEGEKPELQQLLGGLAASATARNRTIDAVAAALPAPPAPVVREVPFSSARRWSATVVERPRRRALVLGAPDVLAPADDRVSAAVADFAAAGRRTLLLGETKDGWLHDGVDVDSVELPSVRPLCLVALREELRSDAAQTLDALRGRDVDLKVISGDHPATVAALVARVGMSPGRVLGGPDIERLDDAELSRAVEETTVFGRVQPQDKRRLVTALRTGGHYVGMTGDGVNDVLALRQANLGIAMESGSAAARAVAGLVLLGDRFDVLPRAIVEGQRVVSSMIAVASLLLSRTIYMLLIVVAGAVLGMPFPFSPKNNAVLALVTVGIPTLLLAVWVPPGRSPPSVVGRVLVFAVPSGIAVGVLALPVLVMAFDGRDPAVGRSIVTTLTVFSGIGLIPLLFPPVADRPSPVGRWGDRRPTALAIAMLVLYGAIFAVPLGRDFFELEPLPADVVAQLMVYTLAWMAALVLALRSGLPERLRSLLRSSRNVLAP